MYHHTAVPNRTEIELRPTHRGGAARAERRSSVPLWQDQRCVRSTLLLALLLGLLGCGADEQRSEPESKSVATTAPEVFDPDAYRGTCMDIYLTLDGYIEGSSELDAEERASCKRLIERAGEACVRLVPGYRRRHECLTREAKYTSDE